MLHLLPFFSSLTQAGRLAERTGKTLFLLAGLLAFSDLTARAEGTRQLEPFDPAAYTTEVTKLMLDNSSSTHRVPFAQVGCASQYRLNIYISDTTERIYLGLNSSSTIYYQLRDPDNQVVTGYSLALIPTTGAGYIPTYTQAYNGPRIGTSNAGGYIPKIVIPHKTGNYYIEFASNSSGANLYGTELNYFDVTVAQGTSFINGRLWSKAWQINSTSDYQTAVPEHQSFSTFYIYTDDGIVNKLYLNGLCGGTFTIYCNQNGVLNTGNWNTDRKSYNSWPSSGCLLYTSPSPRD